MQLYLEKSSELVDGAKQVAHDTSAKAQELEKSAEQKLETTKETVSEKGSEVKAKGAEIIGATQHALAAGAAIVTEKAKHGMEIASGAASNVKAATEQLAGDAQAKVVETAHSAQGLFILE